MQLPLRSMSDERLAALVADGDERAFETLYERYREPIGRYCRSIVHHTEDARDAQQNAAIATLRALRQHPPAGKVKPWLYRIAHNQSVDVLRRRRGHEQLSDETPSQAEPQERLVSWEALLIDLRSLPERQRAALLMRELAGLEYDEIGIALETTGVGARKAVFEARAALHETAAGRSIACEEIRFKISERDGRALRARRIRGHIDDCAACASFAQSVRDRRRVFGTIPVAPASAIGLFGAGAGATGIAGAGGTAGLVGASGATGGLAIKGLALCAVCAIAGTTVIVSGHHQAAPDKLTNTAPSVVTKPATPIERAQPRERAGQPRHSPALASAARAKATVSIQRSRPGATGTGGASAAAMSAPRVHHLNHASPTTSGSPAPAAANGAAPAAPAVSPTSSSTPQGAQPAAGATASGATSTPTASMAAVNPGAALLASLLQHAQAMNMPGLAGVEQQAQQALTTYNAGASFLKQITATLAGAMTHASASSTPTSATSTPAAAPAGMGTTGQTNPLAALLATFFR
ncbi:MAG: RNA polymerase sigma factor [Solirubrobacteraceae bacterium]